MFVPTRAHVQPVATRRLRQVAPLWVTTLNEHLRHLAVPFERDPLGHLPQADQSMPPVGLPTFVGICFSPFSTRSISCHTS